VSRHPLDGITNDWQRLRDVHLTSLASRMPVRTPADFLLELGGE
jgi:hypothetical protein